MARPYNVYIAIPAYNEADNIGRLLERIDAARKDMPRYRVHVVIMDSNSPDGTADVVREAQKHIKDVILLSGEKGGLGRDYMKTFDYILKRDDVDVVMQMDADLSHSAFEIHRLLDKLVEGYDLVIGSRYVRGGYIPGDWPMLRVVNSKVANLVAQFIGGLPAHIKDKTAGFRAFRADALRKVSYHSDHAPGYVFQVNTLNQFLKNDLRVAEVPISFADREFGSSKIAAYKEVSQFIICNYRLNNPSPFRVLLKQLLLMMPSMVTWLGVAWLFNQLESPSLVISTFMGAQAAYVIFLLFNQNYIGGIKRLYAQIVLRDEDVSEITPVRHFVALVSVNALLIANGLALAYLLSLQFNYATLMFQAMILILTTTMMGVYHSVVKRRIEDTST